MQNGMKHEIHTAFPTEFTKIELEQKLSLSGSIVTEVVVRNFDVVILTQTFACEMWQLEQALRREVGCG